MPKIKSKLILNYLSFRDEYEAISLHVTKRVKYQNILI